MRLSLDSRDLEWRIISCEAMSSSHSSAPRFWGISVSVLAPHPGRQTPSIYPTNLVFDKGRGW